MSIELGWGDPEQTIVLVTFADEWQEEKWRTVCRQVIEMLETVDYPVDLVFDGSRVHFTRSSLPGFHMINEWPANVRNTVVISRQPLVQAAVNVISRIFRPRGKRIVVVNNLEEARELLSRLRE